mmetsp:Transcript_10618/g.21182  ORF Transcript_10618/g.21182 Transcript_10618/m.21182 type:complete len:111 (+) Transcript_10618:78-410(+)
MIKSNQIKSNGQISTEQPETKSNRPQQSLRPNNPNTKISKGAAPARRNSTSALLILRNDKAGCIQADQEAPTVRTIYQGNVYNLKISTALKPNSKSESKPTSNQKSKSKS